MSVILTANDRRTMLGVLLLDALLTEEINFDSEVTLYPVEDGTTISDHITEGPERVRIGGVISTADVSGGSGSLSSFGFSASTQVTKLIDVIEALKEMHVARELVEVSTGQLVYRDMAFTHLAAKRSSDGLGGNWVSIEAELIKVNKVRLKTADVPAPETMNAPAAGRGGETNKPAGQSTPSGSNTSGSASGSATNSNAANSASQPRELRSTLYGSRPGTPNQTMPERFTAILTGQ